MSQSNCCDDTYSLMDLTAANSLLFALTVVLVSLIAWAVFNRKSGTEEREETLDNHEEDKSESDISTSIYRDETDRERETQNDELTMTEKNITQYSNDSEVVQPTVSGTTEELDENYDDTTNSEDNKTLTLSSQTEQRDDETEMDVEHETTPLLATMNSQEEIEMKMSEATNDITDEKEQSNEGWIML